MTNNPDPIEVLPVPDVSALLALQQQWLAELMRLNFGLSYEQIREDSAERLSFHSTPRLQPR